MLKFKEPKSLIFLPTLLQVFLFFLYFLNRITFAKSPMVQSDEGFYLQAAARFFKEFKLDVFLHPGRPIFSWPSLVLLKIASLNCHYFSLVFLNAIIYLSIFFISLRIIFKRLNFTPALQALVFSFLLASPIIFNLSAALLGDIPVASWSMLFLALILSPENNSKKTKAWILGVVFCLGFLTKPVFLCFGLTILGAYILAETIRLLQIQSKNKKIESLKDGAIGSGVFVLAFFICGILFFPRDFVQLLKELYYNSNTNSYDVSSEQFDIYYQALWFPHSVFAEFPGLSVVFLLALAGLGFTSRLRSLLKATTETRIHLLKSILCEPVSVISYVFLVLFTYFSFFQHFKDTRETLFLFCLFPLFSVALFANSIYAKRTKTLSLVVSFLGIWNVISMLGATSEWVPRALFDSAFDLKTKSFFQTPVQGVSVSVNYQGTKILDALLVVEKDAESKNLDREVHVFLPNCSSLYNVTTLRGVYQYSKDLPDVLPGLNYDFATKMSMHHATYNRGAFYETGGFPKYFLSGDYIITIDKDKDTCFDKNPKLSVYNDLISKKIKEMSPVYLDGLEKISEITSQYNQKITIYRRNSIPKVENFLKMMADTTELDPVNMWNYPFLQAAKLANPSQSIFDNQMATLRQKLSAGQIGYRYWSSDEGKNFITSSFDGTRNRADLEFPQFLNHLGY